MEKGPWVWEMKRKECREQGWIGGREGTEAVTDRGQHMERPGGTSENPPLGLEKVK